MAQDKQEKELVIRVKNASVDDDYDQLVELSNSGVNVRGMKAHIDDEVIYRELLRLVTQAKTRDSAKVDALRTLAQIHGLLNPAAGKSPLEVKLTINESVDGAEVPVS